MTIWNGQKRQAGTKKIRRRMLTCSIISVRSSTFSSGTSVDGTSGSRKGSKGSKEFDRLGRVVVRVVIVYEW